MACKTTGGEWVRFQITPERILDADQRTLRDIRSALGPQATKTVRRLWTRVTGLALLTEGGVEDTVEKTRRALTREIRQTRALRADYAPTAEYVRDMVGAREEYETVREWRSECRAGSQRMLAHLEECVTVLTEIRSLPSTHLALFIRGG